MVERREVLKGLTAGHNEDLILITETGYQTLHTDEDPLVVT